VAQATKKTANGSAKELPAAAISQPSGGAVQFYREVVREASKVTWPTWKETWLTTVMVFIMVAFTMAFFFLADSLLALGERWLVGAS
jgi:preprotein translocase subunit SecE